MKHYLKADRAGVIEDLAQIIEAIKLYEKWGSDLVIRKRDYLNNGFSTAWLDHKIDINNRVTLRLEERYNRHLEHLNKISE